MCDREFLKWTLKWNYCLHVYKPHALTRLIMLKKLLINPFVTCWSNNRRVSVKTKVPGGMRLFMTQASEISRALTFFICIQEAGEVGN